MQFDSRETIILGIIVIFLGRFINKRVTFLNFYNIPEPVTGGVLASIIFTIFYFLFDLNINFSLDKRDSLLIVFFTCIGLSSKFTTLLQGGKTLVILLFIAIFYLFIQNVTGIGVSILTGLSSQTGVLGGSVSLSGGHGTAIAWSPTFISEYGITNALEIGIACATFGLVLGGIVGGPIANYLITKYNLKSDSKENISITSSDEKKEQITVDSVYSFILVLCIAIGIGLELHKFTQSIGLKLPIFVSCLFAGIILTNTIPYIWKRLYWPTNTTTLSLVSDYSLGLFLSMSLMSLQLWTLIDLALPIVLLLLAQVLVVSLFTIFIVFRVLGKTYDAAIISSGYAGLALGATPTAIANMTAVTKKYGASPQAFIVIPLIGAFFIDIANSFVIQLLLQWLS
jgi:ESS family glutamate:Na+ symporter